MRNKFFKFNENYAKVIKHLDDRQAGQYVRAISDYAFEGKTYGGKDTAVKTAFTLTKQMIDDEKFYREKGRLGGQKIAERKRETEEGNPMEPAEMTLEKYIIDNNLNAATKLKCIRQILYIMSAVHKRDIIHRDISANNIFIISGQLKIADFGLGKDLNVFTSHQTLHTNSVGQYIYCAPEQFMMLKDADKRSDVYSLGRLINFIMTGDPRNTHHFYRNVAEKASCSDAAYRYGDAGQLSFFFEKAVSYHEKAENRERVEQKITNGEYNEEVESYIYDLDSKKIAGEILADKQGVANSLFRFMSESEEHAQYIIQSVDNSFREVCGRSYTSYDKFSSFATRVLYGNFSFVIKETAANILRYVAWDVNRFSAQDMVKELIDSGIEPMLEDIIKH